MRGSRSLNGVAAVFIAAIFALGVQSSSALTIVDDSAFARSFAGNGSVLLVANSSFAQRRDQIIAVQQRLSALGFNPGPIDGVWGSMTATALREYQQQNGLVPTGVVNDRSLELLFPGTDNAEFRASVTAAPSINPSFDCAKAGNNVERSICSSHVLADLDRDLAAKYAAAIASRPEQSDAIRNSQRAWVDRRNNCGADTICLQAIMEARLVSLSSLVLSDAATGASGEQSTAIAGTGLTGTITDQSATAPAWVDPTMFGHWRAQASCGAVNRIFDFTIAQFSDRVRAVGTLSDIRQTRVNHGSVTQFQAVLAFPDTLSVGTTQIPLTVEGGTAFNQRQIVLEYSAQAGALRGIQYGCEPFTFERIEHASATIIPSGSWTGIIEGCRRFGDWGVTAQTHAYGLSTVADIEINNDAGQTFRAFYRLTDETPGALVAIAPISTRQTGASGKRWSGLDGVFEAEMIGDDLLAVEASPSEHVLCGYGELRKSNGADATTEVLSQDVSETPIEGAYLGLAECGRLGRYDMRLDLATNAVGQLAGRTEYAASNFLQSGLIAQDVIARADPNDPEKLQFAVTNNRSSSRADRTPGRFFASRNPEGGIEIEYESGGICQAASLTRIADDERATSAAGQTFFDIRRPNDKCEWLAVWERRLRDEYPDLDANRPVDLESKLANLILDEPFVSVFGTAFPLSAERGRELFNTILACRRDPFHQTSVYWLQTLAPRFTEANYRPAGRLSVPALELHIDRNRSLNARLEKVRQSLAQTASPSMAITELLEVKTYFDHARSSMWPSEAVQHESWLMSALSRFAFAAAEEELETARQSTDINRSLTISSRLFRLDTPYRDYLSETDTDALRDAALTLQNDKVAAEFAAAFDALTEQRPSLATLSEIENTRASLEPMISELAAPLAGRYSADFDRLHQQMLSGLIETRLGILGTLNGDQDGLRASAEWHATFATDFAPYVQTVAYQNALAAFRDHRQGLLATAISEFEDELTNGRNPTKALTAYLSMPGDKEFPVALEYEFFAELYK